MAHPKLVSLAKELGMSLSDRSCTDGYLWDGESLALNRGVYDYETDTIVETKPIPDDQIAHEIGHWLAATPEERSFPEYGCMMGTLFGTVAPVSLEMGWELRNKVCENVLTQEEQSFQEAKADFFGVWLCDQLGIPVEEGARPIYKYSFSYVQVHKHGIETYDYGWAAIAWLFEIQQAIGPKLV